MIFKLAMKYYNTVLSNGERLWSKERIKTLVSRGFLTEDQYKQITGETYGKTAN